MSLSGRFERLRRLAQALMSAQALSCNVCRRSRQTARLVELIDEERGDEFHRCAACGHPITATGEPIGYVESDGTWHGKIIVLEAEPEDESDQEPERVRTA